MTGSQDLRAWIQAIEAHGELLRIAGADKDTEIGAIVSALARERNRPAVLFERIKGDASTALHLVNGLATLPLDPANRPGQTTMPRLIVDACRPFARRGDFPATRDVPSRDTLAALEKKWPRLARIPGARALVAEEGFEPPIQRRGPGGRPPRPGSPAATRKRRAST